MADDRRAGAKRRRERGVQLGQVFGIEVRADWTLLTIDGAHPRTPAHAAGERP